MASYSFVIPTTLLPVNRVAVEYRCEMGLGLGFDPAAVCCSYLLHLLSTFACQLQITS